MHRRDFLTWSGFAALGAAIPESARAIGDASRVTMARLDYGAPGHDLRPTSIRRLLQEVEKRTSISVQTDYPTVSPTGEELFQNPLLAMTGDERFDPLSSEAVESLRTYLQSGGFLFVDSSEGVRDGPFLKSVRRSFQRMFPDKELAEVPSDHVLYKAFYLIEEAVGRIDVSEDLLALFDSDRLYAVVSRNDLLGALARDNFGNWKYEVRSDSEKQREMSFRLGINLMMYALCVNYKSDQVHVPFILKRRKWKVD